MINKESIYYKTLVDEKLKDIFSILKKEVNNKEMPSVLFDAMYYSVFNGGKRIRPILCLTTYNAIKIRNSKFKVKNYEEILPFACGIELVHTFSLIQDDLPSMDNDDFRRGKPSLHRKYNEAIALLAADALFALAFELYTQAEIDDKIKNRAIYELARICGPTGLVAGQTLDITKDVQRSKFKSQKLIDKKKTAELIAGSMKIGAIVAGAKANIINQIEKIGINLGLLFQLTDDILDIYQKSKIKLASFKRERSGNQNLQIETYFEEIKERSSILGKEFNWLIDFGAYIKNRKA